MTRCSEDTLLDSASSPTPGALLTQAAAALGKSFKKDAKRVAGKLDEMSAEELKALKATAEAEGKAPRARSHTDPAAEPPPPPPLNTHGRRRGGERRVVGDGGESPHCAASLACRRR